METPIATRAQGLARMNAFVPSMGQHYADGRNYDLGRGNHAAVSLLSPWIRRRLVTEQELVTAAFRAHGPESAGKFVEEVIWRGYFKGWLERRPQVWSAYVTGLHGDRDAINRDRRLRGTLEQVISGQTGLDGFDAWARELVETGYLHNHARMWFASIWIFTLGLPWRLGADFFLRHLLDGDAASNTLGWRWVAGLHTRGKPYAALPSNIATFTRGRFAPGPGDLAEIVEGLEATEPDGLPPVMPLRTVLPPSPGLPSALLITEEDCRIEEFDLSSFEIRTSATLAASQLRSAAPVSDAVTQFEEMALTDTAARVGVAPLRLSTDAPHMLADWAADAGATQIVTPYVTRGPLFDWIEQVKAPLAERGIALAEWRRDWDSAIWPHATAGFFKVKQQIPRILERIAIT